MSGIPMSRMLMAGLMLVGAAGSSACDEDPTGVLPSPSSTTVIAALKEGIQDEYKAESTYLRVLADFGPVLPFQNIVSAEERHSQALAWMFVRRELDIPLSDWNLDNVPRFGTLAEACAAAVTGEVENIEMYDRFLALELPQDVRNVFENNREASLARHLPAFQACS